MVDQLPETEWDAAGRYLEYLRETGDPLARKLMEAPEDDEEITPGDMVAIREAEEDCKVGRVYSAEVIEHEFGL